MEELNALMQGFAVVLTPMNIGLTDLRVRAMARTRAGTYMVAGTIGGIVNDPRLRARHAFARKLRAQRITADLQV